MKIPKLALLIASALLGLTVACTSDDDGGNGASGSAVTTCEPACDATSCMACNTTGGDPVCVSTCGTGLTCEDGQCLAPTVSSCDPACDGCEVCDTSGDQPVCRPVCAAGLECVAGTCQPPEAPACEPACGECEICDLSGSAPTCRSLCDSSSSCVNGVCQPPDAPTCEPACGECEVCDTSGAAPACVFTCGQEEACQAGKCVRQSIHSNLAQLAGPFSDGPAVTAKCIECHDVEATHLADDAHFQWRGPTPNLVGHENDTLGKRDFINNFCIAVVSNEKRCTQCHAGYGWQDQSYAFDVGDIDCLACHADPGSGYAKDPKTAGAPAATVDLTVAAQSVGATTTKNCGSCHNKAGGGDNVKMGDLGSALNTATVEVDVHLGRGMRCSSCHGDRTSHAMLGQGVSSPVGTSMGCVDCHDAAPHGDTNLDDHALDIACETCHVPAFSRQQPTKMNWDWSTAGNRTRGTDGVEKGTLSDGTEVVTYDAMKGDFVWEKNVRPAYRWYDGRSDHLLVSSTYDPSLGASAQQPVVIAQPVATISDAAAKIYPFKLFSGRQPGHTSGYLIVPHLFGPGGFWGGIPASADYTAQKVTDLWNTALTDGAIAAGQLSSGSTFTSSEWSWVYTEMYMGIHHEVAPASEALGANGGCGDCHNANPAFDFAALGYGCDPMTGSGCGERH